jgi:DNA (cytosine-5)-methyltransferase 1
MDNWKENDGGLRELALFAGAGGGILGGKLLGWRTICAIEFNAYARSILLARQDDGILSPFPIWDNVTTFDGKPWRGIVDVVSGGFPCQDISAAGAGAGIEGKKSGLWKEMLRIINEVRPKFAYMENSPLLVSRGLAVVITDLAKIGYDVKWGCLSAGSAGANHVRNRIWIVATNSNLPQRERGCVSSGVHEKNSNAGHACWWKDSSRVYRKDDVVANRVDRLKAIGNGQVPLVAARAFSLLA